MSDKKVMIRLRNFIRDNSGLFWGFNDEVNKMATLFYFIVPNQKKTPPPSLVSNVVDKITHYR